MKYFDEEIIETKRRIEREKHTNLETGIYVNDDLFTFSQIKLPHSKIRIFLPEQFIVMPDIVKEAKYPTKNAPDFIITSLDSMVNFGFSIININLEAGDTKILSGQLQTALQNVNPAIRIKNQKNDMITKQGNEMSSFDFKGFALDGQNYNRMYIIRMRKSVLHGVFNCPMQYCNEWADIAEKCFVSIEEDV